MGSKNPPRTFYVSALRSAVEQAFEATWTALQARDPFRDFERDYELKTTLRRKRMGLAVDGVTDPIEFREWALEDPEIMPKSRPRIPFGSCESYSKR
jgi:hypothetical protein